MLCPEPGSPSLPLQKSSDESQTPGQALDKKERQVGTWGLIFLQGIKNEASWEIERLCRQRILNSLVSSKWKPYSNYQGKTGQKPLLQVIKIKIAPNVTNQLTDPQEIMLWERHHHVCGSCQNCVTSVQIMKISHKPKLRDMWQSITTHESLKVMEDEIPSIVTDRRRKIDKWMQSGVPQAPGTEWEHGKLVKTKIFKV